MRIANVIQAILPLNGKMMVQCCLKTKSHWMIQTMMPKRKLSHFVVGKKSKELKRYGEDKAWETWCEVIKGLKVHIN